MARHPKKIHALLFNHDVIYNQAAHITPTNGFFMIMWTGTPRIVLSIQYLKRKLGVKSHFTTIEVNQGEQEKK